MTCQKLCDPGHYKDPRVFLDTQEDYSRAQLSLSESFSDQNMSLMLQQHDLEGLCAATRSVTGEYLTEDEQVKFYSMLVCAPSMTPMWRNIKSLHSTNLQSIKYLLVWWPPSARTSTSTGTSTGSTPASRQKLTAS